MSPIAINILIIADGRLQDRAAADNETLRKNYPKGFALDSTHTPHITIFQCYVNKDSLKQALAAVHEIKTSEQSFDLSAIDYHWHPSGDIAVGSILIEKNKALTTYQSQVEKALQPFILPSGNAKAFYREDGEPNIDDSIIDYVSNFEKENTGKGYKPHLTLGLAETEFMKQFANRDFETIDFTAKGISIFQLGNHGTARKKLD